jgi:hypothetical protein
MVGHPGSFTGLSLRGLGALFKLWLWVKWHQCEHSAFSEDR